MIVLPFATWIERGSRGCHVHPQLSHCTGIFVKRGTVEYMPSASGCERHTSRGGGGQLHSVLRRSGGLCRRDFNPPRGIRARLWSAAGVPACSWALRLLCMTV